MGTIVNYSEERSCGDAAVRLIGNDLESAAATAWNGLDCRSPSPLANLTRSTTVL